MREAPTFGRYRLGWEEGRGQVREPFAFSALLIRAFFTLRQMGFLDMSRLSVVRGFAHTIA
jgi:hypothetical protein